MRLGQRHKANRSQAQGFIGVRDCNEARLKDIAATFKFNNGTAKVLHITPCLTRASSVS